MPERWDRWGEWTARWHALVCPECRRLRALDRKIEAGFRSLRDEPVPPEPQARILAAMGIDPSQIPSPRPRVSASPRLRVPPPLRRALALAAPVVAGVFLFLFLTTETPAQTLADTLNAMSRVRSARATGI
jgi:hypothetical protein